ncbi:peptide-methionine (S)-S-oxide reductase [Thiomicrorhabdus immobilis]|uniref:Peptide methionine sulfoxide reductase MsrA n=1 Tax=Thiomicrorhabdus immobilis TaxID=2791037 RepID=A0ABN6CZV5_9GAMM|nr:peptide-methionine (S)-S-oxide reductase MsrA [Thiomicrorhabdus immobilis]BCN93402.1 peptide-methionine (S)-S-oxide reductase [Thiomicrorhabdus immobilis]
MSIETLMIGAGCFWGVELDFSQQQGVIDTAVGYAGGHTDSPTYEEVCRKETMHAEVVLMHFDNQKTTRQILLNHFFAMHNPTTLNQQGPDRGTQYRSVIFYDNQAEKDLAELVMSQQQAGFSQPIVTTLEPMAKFWRAEEYHQQYFKKRGISQGCH